MEIRRTRPQTNKIAINTAIAIVMASWALYIWHTKNDLVLGVLGAMLVVWAAFMLINLIRRQLIIRIEHDGILVRRVLREHAIPFSQMTSSNVGAGGNLAMIGYRRPGETKDRYVGFSKITVGQDGVNAVQQAILDARPDLPEGPTCFSGTPKGKTA